MSDKTQDAKLLQEQFELVDRVRNEANLVLSNETCKPKTHAFMRDIVGVCDLAERLNARAFILDRHIEQPSKN